MLYAGPVHHHVRCGSRGKRDAVFLRGVSESEQLPSATSADIGKVDGMEMIEITEDFIERTIRKRKVPNDTAAIIVDAIGDPGLNTPNDPFFIITSTIIEQPVDFGEISKKYREEWNKSELKAGGLKRGRKKKVLNDASALNPDIRAVFIDKNADDNPLWWNEPKNRKRPHYRTLSELMDETFSQTDKDDFFVIVDNHQDLEGGIGEGIVKESAERNNKTLINCVVDDSEEGDFKDLLQTNDFIPRELFDRIRDNKPNSEIKIWQKRLRS